MPRVPKIGRMLHRLTLQSRFALMAALAVSVAVVAAAVISYFLVEGQLSNEVDAQLTGGSGAHQPVNPAGGVHGPGDGVPGSDTAPAALMASCQAYALKPKANLPDDLGLGFLGLRLGRAGSYIVSSGGSICSVFPQHGDLGTTASAAQISVAGGETDKIFYDTYTATGEHVRVYTEYSGEKGYAYSSVASLSHMDGSLHSLAIGLLFASLGGILLAGAAGFLVARSVLKPVRRLTRAAEHVVATDDLSVQLPVEGTDELSRLGKAFNRMTRSLAGSRERQQRLIADAGHELRTPLTSLRANVDVLLRVRRSGRQLPAGREQAMLESVDQQLHELSGLVSDLLELSRNAEAGRGRTMRVALHDSVGRAVERAKLRGPGLEFDVEIDEPWFVEGDPTGLDRAVVNLLDNAVKFSPAGGVVTVRLTRGEYSVRDQGPGIDSRDLPRVFERFYRSDSARQLPGSGLGLAIVAQVAEETGGRIALEPAVGGGTLARLTLPGDPGTQEPGTAARHR